MKRLAMVFALLVVSSAVAQAGSYSYLKMTTWDVPGGSATVQLWNDNGTMHLSKYAGVGSFRANYGPNSNPTTPIRGNLYCLDIRYSFSFNQQWEVTRYTIPPWNEPPPYSVYEAAWIYQTYGKTATTSAQAYGAQMALWEVAHESNWRDTYDSTNWWTTGNFRATASGTGLTEATAILNNLKDNYTVEQIEASGKQAYYYRPKEGSAGQGQIGDIPEPSTLILLGLGLTAAGVGVIRRRKA